MTYQQFYSQWHRFACFSTCQVQAIHPSFNRSNLFHWQQNGYIVMLRRRWYAFADYLDKPDYARYFANQICAPSYISLHYALSFYGIIPEAVVEITSITTRKPQRYSNTFGLYSYQSVRPSFFWGYKPMIMPGGMQYMIATPEKALLDLLYLYPQYTTAQDMLELRLDDDFMHTSFSEDVFMDYTKRANSPALTMRVNKLLKAYDL